MHTVPLFKRQKVIPTSSFVILLESFIWKCVTVSTALVNFNFITVLFADQEPVEDAPLDSVNWHDSALCRDSVERLYSFSIISARVFSFLASRVAPTAEMKQC